MPFDQRSLIHLEAWFPPCFVRQNQQQQKKTEGRCFEKRRFSQQTLFLNSNPSKIHNCFAITSEPLTHTFSSQIFEVFLDKGHWFLLEYKYVNKSLLCGFIWTDLPVRLYLESVAHSTGITTMEHYIGPSMYIFRI